MLAVGAGCAAAGAWKAAAAGTLMPTPGQEEHKRNEVKSAVMQREDNTPSLVFELAAFPPL
ncbi:hypothetical protein EYF80_034183 [Liparis tanakae]|uniref:Uncharacterized protein n=1 Tax=Liparis tanakae TaxID=230148 RepID=A0A4Z2GQ57_9TELE|nr:hypothetical protein EYF80_034183 [Liparis tanakae]